MQPDNMIKMDISDRVTRLETQVGAMDKNIGEIKQQLRQTATKEDVKELKEFFETRDKHNTDFIKKITWTLLILFGLAVATAFGLDLGEKVKALGGGL
jgi:hypothetical protein